MRAATDRTGAPRTTARAATDQPDVLRQAARALWPNLPVMVAASVLCSIAFVPAFFVSPGLTPLGALLLGAALGPAWMAVVAVTDAMVDGADVRVASLLTAVRRHGTAGLRTAAVPAVCAAALLVTWAMYAAQPAPWLLACMAVDGGVLVLVAVGLPFAFSWRLATGQSGRRLWFAACVQGLSRPVLSLGTAAVVVLALMAGTSWAVSLLFLVPGPLALLCSVASHAVRVDLGLLPDASTRKGSAS